MNAEAFEDVVAETARRQAERLRGMGFGAAAAELDALLLETIPLRELEHTEAIAC